MYDHESAPYGYSRKKFLTDQNVTPYWQINSSIWSKYFTDFTHHLEALSRKLAIRVLFSEIVLRPDTHLLQTRLTKLLTRVFEMCYSPDEPDRDGHHMSLASNAPGAPWLKPIVESCATERIAHI